MHGGKSRTIVWLSELPHYLLPLGMHGAVGWKIYDPSDSDP